MSVQPKELVSNAVLTGAVVTYYGPVPSGKVATIKSASVSNSTAGVVAVTVYRVKNGGTAGAGSMQISARNVAVGETYNCPELINKVLEAGGTIQALGNGLGFDVSGTESVA
jgi:hypothetical protein